MMYISDLIRKLQVTKHVNGDIPVDIECGHSECTSSTTRMKEENITVVENRGKRRLLITRKLI